MSKYNTFWLRLIDVLADLIEEAYTRGRSRAIDVSGLRSYGNRGSWYGSVIISRKGIIRGEMAHARSLGKVLVWEGVIDRFGDSVFVIKISGRLKLRVELLRKGEGIEGRISARGPERRDRLGNEVVDESVYLRIHELLELLPVYVYPFCFDDVPSNGIYFFYEEGEVIESGGRVINRIVRVGTHKEQGRLPHRLSEHFRGNRNSSVFRRHLGAALLARYGLRHDEDGIEGLISKVLKERFSFRVVRVDDAEERLELEERLIATLAKFSPKYVSPHWLGRWSPNDKIRGSGLWNVDHVDSPRLMTPEYMKRFEQLVYRTLIGGEEVALILIPCSKSKRVLPAREPLAEPLSGITDLRGRAPRDN